MDFVFFFFFKQKTAYEITHSDWSSDVCSSDLKRNRLLVKMTDEVAELVLEDNRLQTLALSIAEAGGTVALPGYVRTIELLEAMGRLDRKVEGLASSEDLSRRAQENHGLTRPELAVILSLS